MRRKSASSADVLCFRNSSTEPRYKARGPACAYSAMADMDAGLAQVAVNGTSDKPMVDG